MRLDQLLVLQGLCPGRDRAKELIRQGLVLVDDKVAKKASQDVPEYSDLQVTGDMLRYVSRGGLKLEKALESFPIDLSGKVCMDIGASTGGFTDCMLQHGARKVYAVDVGQGQLASSLRDDSRVVNMEDTNIRLAALDPLYGTLDFISVDVSFLSLTYVFPIMKKLLGTCAQSVCLVKPQFEAGKGAVGKSGVVRDRKVQEMVLRKVLVVAETEGLYPQGLTFSPVKGPNGNIEFLLFCDTIRRQVFTPDVENLTLQARKMLNREF